MLTEQVLTISTSFWRMKLFCLYPGLRGTSKILKKQTPRYLMVDSALKSEMSFKIIELLSHQLLAKLYL